MEEQELTIETRRMHAFQQRINSSGDGGRSLKGRGKCYYKKGKGNKGAFQKGKRCRKGKHLFSDLGRSFDA